MKKCKCGKRATISLSAGGREISLCDACWDRHTKKIIEKAKRGPHEEL